MSDALKMVKIKPKENIYCTRWGVTIALNDVQICVILNSLNMLLLKGGHGNNF